MTENILIVIFASSLFYTLWNFYTVDLPNRERVENARRQALADHARIGSVFYREGVIPIASEKPFMYPRCTTSSFREWYINTNDSRTLELKLREARNAVNDAKEIIKHMRSTGQLPKTKKKAKRKKK